MFQIILTYSILGLAIAYVIYKLVRTIFPKKEEIIGCGSNCGCDAVKLQKEIMELSRNKKPSSDLLSP